MQYTPVLKLLQRSIQQCVLSSIVGSELEGEISAAVPCNRCGQRRMEAENIVDYELYPNEGTGLWKIAF